MADTDTRARALENLPWLDEVVGHMNRFGWDVHSFDHQDANSHFRFRFRLCGVLTIADRFGASPSVS
jgi:hypothetical protein